MIVLVVGCDGQVGRALMRSVPDGVECVGVDLPDIDITHAEAVEEIIERVAPTSVVNAAAYTAVDLAEEQVVQAHEANEIGPRNLARAARRVGARLIHFSTDFVFDGKKCRPYLPEDEPRPLSVYGVSKLAGERAVHQELGADGLVLRTSWVHSPDGRNFVKTMLELFRSGREVRVVGDQVGSPTAAHDLARIVWSLVPLKSAFGEQTLHVANLGICSWYDLAVAVAEIGLQEGLISMVPSIEPIPSEGYPTPAARPPYSVLETSRTWQVVGYRLPHWRSALTRVLKDLAVSSNA